MEKKVVHANNLTITISDATIVGNYNVIVGNGNTILGWNCTVKGNGNTVTGDKCTGKGRNNRIIGNGNIWDGVDNEMQGKRNVDKGTKTPPPPPRRVVNADEGIDVNLANLLFHWVAVEENERPRKKKSHIDVPTNVQADQEAKEDQPKCSLCLTNVANCAMVPCGHCIVCISCSKDFVDKNSKRMLPCPSCRKEVDQIIQIFT